VVAPGDGERVSLAAGVEAEWLVGQHVGARNLATGLITVAPSAASTPLSHPHYASLTLLAGLATIRLGDQRVELRPLDHLMIQPGQAHVFVNPQGDRPAVFHAAFPTAQPRYAPAKWPSTGPALLTRYDKTERNEISPGAIFIDHFNARRIPGIRMCGGLGTFSPAARLPAHAHDFDESICIVAGQAVCWTEGQRRAIDGCATALQPRGRVHYFVNETNALMTMIWVYAGPMPQRIVVDERCATQSGFAWPQERGT
jgi:quercetin dioxygenase-like cupin family protein